MGCNPSQQTQKPSIYDSIVYNLERGNIESFDQEMIRAENILRDAEIARHNFTSNFGKLIYQTGSILLVKPSLANSIQGLYFQTARDCSPEVFTVIKINQDAKPNLKILEGNSPSKSMNESCEAINRYIDDSQKIEISKISGDISDLLNVFITKEKSWKEQFSNKNKNDEKAGINFSFKLNSIRNKYQKANTTFQEISSHISLIKNDLKHICEIYSTEASKKNIIELFKKINNDTKTKKVDDNRELFKLYKIGNVKGEEINLEWSFIYQNKILTNKLYSGTIQQLPAKTPEKKPQEEPPTTKVQNIEKTEKVENKPVEPQPDENKQKLQELLNSQHEKEEEANILKMKMNNKPTIYINNSIGLKSWNISINDSRVLDNECYAKCFCINHEENLLHLGTNTGKIHTFNLNTNEFVSCVEAHTKSVKAINYFNDKNTIISGGKDGKMFKWDFKTLNGSPSEFKRKSVGPINCIESIMDGETIYVGSGSNLIVFDIYRMSEVQSFDFKSEITKLIWIRQGGYIAAGLRDGGIILFNHENKSIYDTIRHHSQKVTGLTICDVNNQSKITLASCSKDNTVKLYNIVSKTTITTIDSINNSKQFFPKDIIYCHDNKSLITTNGNGHFYIFDYSKPEKKKFFFSNDVSITCAIYVGDSSTIILGKKNSSIDFFAAK